MEENINPRAEVTANIPKSVEEAVEAFEQDNDVESAIAYLIANRGDTAEFCLQVRDRYSEQDTATAFLRISSVIEALINRI